METETPDGAGFGLQGFAPSARLFGKLADSLPQMVWSTPPDGGVDYVNRHWVAFTGAPATASLGDAWMQFLHPQDIAIAHAEWQRAVASRSAYEVEYRLRHHSGEYRWVLARGVPVCHANGDIARWVGTSTDIHQQKVDAEQLEILSHELSHRIKNIFAVIGGLISMSMRNNPELHGIASELHARVLALGRAHDFVRPNGEQAPHLASPASLKGMLDSLLRPYANQGRSNVAIIGPDIRIDDRSATPLALFFHELATNAAKYGALSAEDGRVEITISEAVPALGAADPPQQDGERWITLAWHERGGPPVAPPVETGFGYRLIDMSISRQLGGTLTYAWNADGLAVTACIRRTMLTREGEDRIPRGGALRNDGSGT